MASSVVTVIKEQHREIEKLLKKAEDDKGDVGATMQKLYDMLKPHADAEEDFVYPSIKKHASDTGDEIKDGTVEHQQVVDMLEDLLKGEPGDPGYDGTVASIAAQLRHHHDEEEADLLPVLSDKATRAELEALGERFLKATGKA